MFMARHFSEKETIGLQEGLVIALDRAREYAGVPFVITSGARTPEQNAKVGGVKDSAHVKGLAVDLLLPDDRNQQLAMAWGLGLAGFARIGIYKKHFHVDIDTTKPQNVIWVLEKD